VVVIEVLEGESVRLSFNFVRLVDFPTSRSSPSSSSFLPELTSPTDLIILSRKMSSSSSPAPTAAGSTPASCSELIPPSAKKSKKAASLW